jgi:hypothetical protein
MLVRIRDVYPDPRSEFFHSASRIQCLKDSGSRIRFRIKELGIFNRKKGFLSFRKYDPGCSSRIVDPDFFPSRIPGPEGQKAPDPGSAKLPTPTLAIFAIFATLFLTEFRQQLLRRKDPVRVVLAESVKGPVQGLGDDPEVGVLGPHLQEPGGEQSKDGGRTRLSHPLGRQLRQVAEDVDKVYPNAHHLNNPGYI